MNILSHNGLSVKEIIELQRKGECSTATALKEILKEICRLDWIEGAAVARRDGVLMVAHTSWPTTTDTTNACAIMSATIVGAAKNITTKCKMGFPKRIIIQAKSGDIIISEAGDKALLVCLANVRYDPALMFDDIEKTAKKIDEIL